MRARQRTLRQANATLQAQGVFHFVSPLMLTSSTTCPQHNWQALRHRSYSRCTKEPGLPSGPNLGSLTMADSSAPSGDDLGGMSQSTQVVVICAGEFGFSSRMAWTLVAKPLLDTHRPALATATAVPCRYWRSAARAGSGVRAVQLRQVPGKSRGLPAAQAGQVRRARGGRAGGRGRVPQIAHVFSC